ncbi:hypothetical protein [Methylocapsa acidiphila]|uniref:hypothetical protein n=1 Tax=Methylocapsa acidiphila TaxID=133552 RepID=UPI0012EC983E|nr:hypothetical protein [Methylocapsa acidiphila]
MERWVGIAVSGDRITLVDASVETGKPLLIKSDQTLKLQKGDRAAAYAVVHGQVSDYISNHKIGRVVIKASAVSQSGSGKSHLDAAELRGVVMAAAASATEVSTIAKAQISKTFGSRKFDEYVRDDGFWTTAIAGVALRAGSRDAALLLLAAKD